MSVHSKMMWVLALLAYALLGCTADVTDAPSAKGGKYVLAEFDVQALPRGVDGKSKAVFLLDDVAQEAVSTNGPSLAPLAYGDANLCQDGVQGSNDPTACGLPAGTQTVDLVTDSVVDTFGTGDTPDGLGNICPAGKFCAAVELESYWQRPLSHVYTVVTAMWDDNGQPFAISHDAHAYSDANPTGCTAQSNCPNNSLGLWLYTGQTSSNPGVVGIGPTHGVSNPRFWVFDNPDDANWSARLQVVAALTYGSYGFASASQAYVDACSGGTVVASSTATVSLPFPFTLGDTTYIGASQQVNLSSRGVLSFGSAAPVTSKTNMAPTNGSAPANIVSAFWEDVDFGPVGSHMCYRVIGAEPNRQFAVSWVNMNLSGSSPPFSLTFGALLLEGTDQIYLAHSAMVPPDMKKSSVDRAAGKQATVGVHLTGTNGAGTFKSADYPSGTKKELKPVP